MRPPRPRPRKGGHLGKGKRKWQFNFYVIVVVVVVLYFLFVQSLFDDITEIQLKTGSIQPRKSKAKKISNKHNLESILLEGLPPNIKTQSRDIEAEKELPLNAMFPDSEAFNDLVIPSTDLDNGASETASLVYILSQQRETEDLGEIFTPGLFHGKNYPPRMDSVTKYPGDDDIRDKILSHIRRSLAASRLQGRRGIVGIRLWHAWMNGVSIDWLLEQLLQLGGCSHLMLISRNPVRVMISDLMARDALDKNKNKRAPTISSSSSWASQSSTCEDKTLRYSLGVEHVVSVALEQYRGFRDATNVVGLQSIGVSYEFEVQQLQYPEQDLQGTTYRRIMNFLSFDETWSEGDDPPVLEEPDCPLSVILLNYEELFCSVSAWDKAISNMLPESASIVDPLEWMVADVDTDESALSFQRMIMSWAILDKFIQRPKPSPNSTFTFDYYTENAVLGQGWNHSAKCSEEELASTRYGKKAIRRMRRKQFGSCGIGGKDFSKHCHELDTSSAMTCLFALQRTECGAMTFQNNKCILHEIGKKDFQLEKCNINDFYWRKVWSGSSNNGSLFWNPFS